MARWPGSSSPQGCPDARHALEALDLGSERGRGTPGRLFSFKTDQKGGSLKEDIALTRGSLVNPGKFLDPVFLNKNAY